MECKPGAVCRRLCSVRDCEWVWVGPVAGVSHCSGLVIGPSGPSITGALMVQACVGSVGGCLPSRFPTRVGLGRLGWGPILAQTRCLSRRSVWARRTLCLRKGQSSCSDETQVLSLRVLPLWGLEAGQVGAVRGPGGAQRSAAVRLCVLLCVCVHAGQ